MKLITAWNLYFKQFETAKARMMYSKWKYLVKVIEFMTGEYICTRCNMSTLMGEHPGEFKDFDADPDRGGDGIALCTQCVGTGKYKKTKEFQELQEEAEKARKASWYLFKSIIENKNWPWYREEIGKVNARIVDISGRALRVIKNPDKNCLALRIQKK